MSTPPLEPASNSNTRRLGQSDTLRQSAGADLNEAKIKQ